MGGDPPLAGALPDCRDPYRQQSSWDTPAKDFEQGRLIGTLLSSPQWRILQRIWESFGQSVRSPSQHRSAAPPPTQFLLGCQVCIAFQSLSSPAPALIFLYPYSFSKSDSFRCLLHGGSEPTNSSNLTDADFDIPSQVWFLTLRARGLATCFR